MKPLRAFLTLAVLSAGLSITEAQNGGFDLEAYKQFLAAHQDLESSQLRSMYPAGAFQATVASPASTPLYLDSIIIKYGLTAFEQEQIQTHGFVVTSRLAKHTFVESLSDIYQKDLPVFVSTDAILQAIHNSYDNILKEVENKLLLPELDSVLSDLHGHLPVLAQHYSAEPAMLQMLHDVDVYLTIPLRLLGKTTSPYFSDNAPWVDQLLQFIQAQQPVEIPLFANTPRKMDFSQFTVRGHYTLDPQLGKYFQAMMWLGRTEIYLSAPKGTTTEWPREDIQRQTIDALLIAEGVRGAGILVHLGKIDATLQFFVGESDNVTVDNLGTVMQQVGVQSASELLDTTRWENFQTTLLQNLFAYQRINSQLLFTDPCHPEDVQPASAFLLLGQRFVIDSYITGNVVYDKIVYGGQAIRRMLPSTLDVLFALGNNAAAQLLEPELGQYHYATNLAALRYLVNSYDQGFWTSSMFNSWLQIIRTLNAPADRTSLPSFMQTAAWWQEKMNTQLGSWAQLRHDNLLYAKQSYTPGIICSFPESYVEPIPAFYLAVKTYADTAGSRFAAMGMPAIQAYFQLLSGTADTLGAIAEKELDGTPLLPEESMFLRSMLVPMNVCGMPYTGWYAALYYGMQFVPGDSERKTDFIVADVHTAPTDAAGFVTGWVLHVGTGPVDLAILCSELPDGRSCAFVGPVINYYEHLSTNFKRLTDEEWATMYIVAPSLRPSFINTYSADDMGSSRGYGPSLLAGVANDPLPPRPGTVSLYQNFPNPFNSSTIIPFTIPASSAPHQVRLEIYDIHGRLVARLLDTRLLGGNYTVRWDGNTLSRLPAASGVYFYRLISDEFTLAKKLVLVK